jgi:thiol-disulfide isomerase/thioredoxin
VRRLSFLLLIAIVGCTKAPRNAAPGPAPAFELPDLAGGTLSLAALQGKVVVLDFWATWCAPCIAELPDLAQFARKNAPRGVEVIGVVLDSGEPQDISDFVRDHKITYRQLIGNEEVRDAYDANQGYPTTFVIDPAGRLVTRTLGAVPDKFERLQKAVDAALAHP